MPGTSVCCLAATAAAVTGNETNEAISFTDELETGESDCPWTTPTDVAEDEAGAVCRRESCTTADECMTCSTVSNASKHAEKKRMTDGGTGQGLKFDVLRRREDVRFLSIENGMLLFLLFAVLAAAGLLWLVWGLVLGDVENNDESVVVVVFVIIVGRVVTTDGAIERRKR